MPVIVIRSKFHIIVITCCSMLSDAKYPYILLEKVEAFISSLARNKKIGLTGWISTFFSITTVTNFNMGVAAMTRHWHTSCLITYAVILIFLHRLLNIDPFWMLVTIFARLATLQNAGRMYNKDSFWFVSIFLFKTLILNCQLSELYFDIKMTLNHPG